ncbi:hypothetical protein PSCICE_23200 [Pseudomonas cichorii]|nr:hypothetical protein PSCICE_23200 [Pseudomonas cichorii]
MLIKIQAFRGDSGVSTAAAGPVQGCALRNAVRAATIASLRRRAILSGLLPMSHPWADGQGVSGKNKIPAGIPDLP